MLIFLQVLEVYTKSLITYKLISGNCSTLSKNQIFIIKRDFQAKNKGNGLV